MGFDGYIAKPISQNVLLKRLPALQREDSLDFPDEARLLNQCADDPAPSVNF